MIDHRYHSAVVAPLLARGRTLGALSILRLGDSEPYDAHDLDLACELARRAALAIDNARLFSEVRAVEERLEAILVNLAEAITLADDRGRMVFANQAAADLLGASSPAELMSAPPGTIMSALPGARRGRSGARPRGDARQTPVRGRAPDRCWCATSSARAERSAG